MALNTNKKSSIHLGVKLTTEDAQAAIKALATQFENIQKISEIGLNIKNLKGVDALLGQLQSLDTTLTSLLANSHLVGSGLSENVAGAVNSVIDNFQKGNSLADGFLKELNEISNATDKSAIPEKIKSFVDKINVAFKDLGIGTKINAEDILNLNGVQEQLTSLANYVTQFTSGWSAGMTFAAKQTNGLVQATGNIDAKINALIEKLNKLKVVENSIGSIFKKLSSGAEFAGLNAKEKDEINDFAADVLNKYNKAKEIFTSSQSTLEMRRKAAIDMAKAAKDSIRVLSYEDNGFEIYDMVDQKIIDGLSKIKKDILSRSEEIKSTLRTEITSIEKQLTYAGIDIKTQVNVTPKADPKAGQKIKQAVEDSAPKSVDVPVQANIDTEHAKEVLSIAEQLQKVFDIGRKKNTLEYKILFTTDGLDIRNGSFQGINSKTYAEALLGNLMKGVNVNAHSHMGKYSEFTLDDIKSAVDAKKNLGINLSAVIGPDDISTLDLAQVKLEDLYKLLEKLSKLPYANSTGILAKDLNNALKEINPEYGDIFNKWQPEKFIDLAKYINSVSQAAQGTIDPLEQFKNIVSFIAAKDIDFSKYQNALNSLSGNNFSPEALRDAFNEIAKAENLMSDGKILKIDLPEKSTLDAVTKSLQEQIEAYRTKRKEAGLTFDKLRQEILMLEGNYYNTKDSFIERYFHPAEIDDVVKALKSGDSVKKITEKLASEFNIEIPVKPKVDTKNIDDSSKSAVQSLEQIEQQEKEIAEAARKREEAQRKANEEGSKPVKTGGTGAGTGTGTGVGGTTPQSGTGTGSSVSLEVADLERLKQKVTEVQLEVLKKTRAFNDEKTAVANVVTDEIANLERLLTKVKQITGEVNNYSTAWTNADGNITGIIEKENQLFEELRKKLQGIADILAKEISNIKINNNIANIISGQDGKDVISPKHEGTSNNSQFSSTLETLNATLSRMIGTGDESSQKTSPNQGLSGIAKNVEGIYRILNNPSKLDSDKDQNDADHKLTGVLTGLQNTLDRFAGINDSSSKSPENDGGISGIAKNVANIAAAVTARQNDDSPLANSIKSAVDALNNAAKDIADDAKLRQESNTKYQAASDRISTEAGRSDVFRLATKDYKDYSSVDSISYSPLSGGVVKVETVLKDLGGHFYDFAATVDSQGVVAVKKLEQNGSKSISVQNKLAEQEKALAKAQEEASRIKAQAIADAEQQKTQATKTISIDTLNGAIKSTKSRYDNYSGSNIGRVDSNIFNEYNELLQLIENIKQAGNMMSESEAKNIEDRCNKIQNEISLQNIVTKNYDERLASIKASASADDKSLIGKEDAKTAQKYFDEIEKRVQSLNAKKVQDHALLNRNELELEQKELDELIAKTEKFVESAKKAKTVGALDGKKANYFNKETVAYNSAVSDSAGLNLGENGIAALNRYKQAYTDLLEKKQYFQSISKNDVTEADIQEWDRLTKGLAECRKEYEVFAQAYSKENVIPISKEDAQNVDKLKEGMIRLAASGENGRETTRKFSKDYQQLSMTFRDVNNELKEVIVTYNATTGTLTKSIGSVNKVKSSWEDFAGKVGNKIREMGAYFATFGSIYRVIAVVRQGVTYVREIDSALTELKKVTDETDESYKNFLQDMSKTAGVIGSTVQELTTMASEWARLGYSMQESAKLAESTAILLNVSEFSDATAASEALISTMQAFQYAADESTHVVDILNEVGKILPVDNYIG